MSWLKLADEGGSADVAPDSTVRYGASPDERFIERVVSGRVVASNGFFGGDPAPNTRKGLWLLQQDQPPAPEPPAPPTPEPAPPPDGLPPLSDPQFAERMRLLEYAQRERHNTAAEQRNAALVQANTRLAESQEAAQRSYAEVAAKYDALIRLLQEGAEQPPADPPQWAGDVRQALQTAAQALLAAAQAIPSE